MILFAEANEIENVWRVDLKLGVYMKVRRERHHDKASFYYREHK